MAALSTAILASAAVGSAAAIYNGSQQAKAIKNAANQTAQANQQAINFAREGRDYAASVLSKYSQTGDAARNRMNAFLGIKPTASGSYSGAMGSAGMPDYAAYVRNNPDLMAEWSKPGVQQMFNGDAAAYGQFHYQRNGQVEGRQLPTMGGAQGGSDPSTATPAETQEDAWAAYEASPWGKIGTLEADKATQDFLSMAGAQGSTLAGRTARGMQQIGEESKLRNFTNYYGALGNAADTGFRADTGIASGGQNFAESAANITQQGGQQAAQYSIAKGQNQANTVDDLASWIGWGMGSMPTGGGGTATSTMSSAASPSRTAQPYMGGLGSRIR